MTPEDLEGLVIGPVTHRVDRERVDAFVDVTGDDPDRWTAFAPPGYASVLLFAVAGELLTDERIAAYLATLIHVDQQFTYASAIGVGTTVEMTGTVQRVRERGGAYFVTFVAEGRVGDRVVLESRSTFIMSATAATERADELSEPSVYERGENRTAGSIHRAVDGEVAVAGKSASRSDLVRYAAVTGDFNPLHWDHDTAVRAGLPGTVVHGLLMMAWLAQQACSFGPEPNPVEAIKVRFRSALRPGASARVEATVTEALPGGETAKLALRLTADDEDVVTGTATVRPAGVTP